LKKVQQITFAGDDAHVLCCFESGPCESLNASTGKSGRSLRGVRGIWESPFAPVRFLERSRDYAIADAEASIASIPRVTFGVLNVAFSPSIVCVSEVGGPVRTFDSSTGNEVWRFTPAKGTHFLRISFCESLRCFAGVSWPYERGGPQLLQVFAAGNGSPTVITEVGQAADVEFASSGARVVTSEGVVYDVVSGGVSASLPFPSA
jgi:hypothetical protein